MTYLNEAKKTTCNVFFKKSKYFYHWYIIKDILLMFDFNVIGKLFDFCTNNKSMTNQFILSYIYKNIMLFQLCLKGHEFYNVHTFAGYKLVMEDEYIIHTDFENKLQFCAVFDGHGGRLCVTYLKDNYIQLLYNNLHFKNFLKTHLCDDMSNALKTVTREVDDHIINIKIKGGSTAIIVIVTCHHIYVSNLGDSRAIVIKNNKFDFFATTDQKPLMYENRINTAGGFVRKNRVDGVLAIGNCFGDIQFKNNANLNILEQKVVADCEITVIENNFDVLGIIMGCDGIFDVYDNDEIVNDFCAITKKYNGNHAEILINLCLLKDSYDNLTICTSFKRNKKYEIIDIFTSETFNFLKLISGFVEKAQKLTKSQLKKHELTSFIQRTTPIEITPFEQTITTLQRELTSEQIIVSTIENINLQQNKKQKKKKH